MIRFFDDRFIDPGLLFYIMNLLQRKAASSVSLEIAKHSEQSS